MDYSPLERLPAELMQTIFLLSGYNIALARASRCIGDLLSNEYIYHSVCDHYLARRHDCHVEQSKAQTSIFATKWMTWTFFQKWIIRTYQRKGCLCGRTPEKGCFDDQWPPAFENPTSMVFSRSHLPRLAFIHGRIPTKLLHRPWTQDKIQFLRFLLWLTSMTVDWMNPEVHRLVTNGRRQAFLDQNLDAVILFNHNRRLGKPPNLSVIRFAIIDAGCNRSIVFDTMLAAYIWGRRGHSWQCPELDKWCENRIKLGDMKGHWVKAQLDEYRRTEHAGVVRWKYDGVGWAREDGIVQEPCRTWSSQHNHIDTKAGDYDGGPEDTLVRPKLCWNSKVNQMGWFCKWSGSLDSSQASSCHSVYMSDIGLGSTSVSTFNIGSMWNNWVYSKEAYIAGRSIPIERRSYSMYFSQVPHSKPLIERRAYISKNRKCRKRLRSSNDNDFGQQPQHSKAGLSTPMTKQPRTNGK